MKRAFFAAAAIVLAIAAGVKLSRSLRARLEARRPGLTLTSPDLEDGGIIAERLSMRGAGQNPASPKLEWSNVPDGTQSFVLLFHDPDVSLQNTTEDVTHWLAFNIPGAVRELAANLPADARLTDGTVQLQNAMGRPGYTGPGMGPGGPYHHYTFELMALDTKLELNENATRLDVMKAIDGHILAKGILQGRYHQ
jgi:Raf kinase inhibitor-like YbhB/YbcL family protein